MNRRGFLRLMGGGIAATVAAPYVITTPGLLMPVKALWTPGPYDVVVPVTGNRLLTIEMITREALEILHKNLNFVRDINNDYSESFKNANLIIRRPR